METIVLTKSFFSMSQACLAGRAALQAALRHLPDDRYEAGEEVSVQVTFMPDAEPPWGQKRTLVWKCGGKPRRPKSEADWLDEVEAAVAHTKADR